MRTDSTNDPNSSCPKKFVNLQRGNIAPFISDLQEIVRCNPVVYLSLSVSVRLYVCVCEVVAHVLFMRS